MKLLLVVAVALFDEDNRVLIAQRPQGKALAGLWEFPGGKVEAGERPGAASSEESVCPAREGCGLLAPANAI